MFTLVHPEDVREIVERQGVSEALQILLDAGIASYDEVEPVHGEPDRFRFELRGPWQGSDYSGDDINESNQRSLARDYPHLLIPVTKYWAHNGYGLQVDDDFGQDPETAEDAVELAKLLVELTTDYPLYDESDHSDLIYERAEQAWDSYLRRDLEYEVERLLGAVDVYLNGLKEVFWDTLSDHEIWPEAEGHRDVIFPGIEDEEFLADFTERVLEAGAVDLDDVHDVDLTPAGRELINRVRRRLDKGDD